MAKNLLLGTLRTLNAAVECRINSLLQSYFPTPLPLVSCVSEGRDHPLCHRYPALDASRDFGILFSKRKQGDVFTSEWIDEENKGYWNRSNRDVLIDKRLDFEAECPMWLVNRRGREWRPALPRFIEGVIVDLQTRKPKKPNSGNRKVAKVQITVQGQQRVVTARIQGEKNTLQQHHRVLVQYCRARNLPTVKWVIVRGQLDAQY
jgi:hypothetical protein